MTKISKWQQGVNLYAEELRETLAGYGLEITEANMLNGATNWKDYSYGGNGLIYDMDIAERLATPSEIKKRTLKDGLSSYANASEQWLDVQARALHQACEQVLKQELEAGE